MQVVIVNLRTDGKYSRQPQKQPAQGCHRREAPLPFFALKQSVLPTVTIAKIGNLLQQQLPTTATKTFQVSVSAVDSLRSWLSQLEAKYMRHADTFEQQTSNGDQVINWLRPLFLSTLNYLASAVSSVQTLCSASASASFVQTRLYLS